MKISPIFALSVIPTLTVNAAAIDINKISIPSPTGSYLFPFGIGHGGDDMKVTTITRNQQQQLIKIFNDLHTRFTHFSEPKKVAVMVEHDSIGLHVQLQCLLKGKKVVSKPSPEPSSPAPAPPQTTPQVPSRTTAQTTAQTTTEAFSQASTQAPVPTFTGPRKLVPPPGNGNVKLAHVDTSNDSDDIEAVIARVEYIETVLKSFYLLDLNEINKNIMSDFLNSKFKLPTGFIQGILSNYFDHNIDWDMAEKYVLYL